MNTKQRFAYLDLLKGIAMLCVCMYHFSWAGMPEYAQSLPASALAQRFFFGMNSICVPLFVMVNGALSLSRPFHARRHAAHCLQLVVGVLIWYVLTMAAAHAWQGGAAYAVSILPAILRSAPYLYEYGGVTMGHLWFIPMLIALHMLVPLIYAAFDSTDGQIRRGLGWMLGALIALCFLTQDFDHVKSMLPGLSGFDSSWADMFSPARNRVYGAMIVYFVLGGALHGRREQMLRVPSAACAALILGGALLLFAELMAVSREKGAFYDMVYHGYNTLPTLLMACGVFIAAAKADARLDLSRGLAGRIIAAAGRNTLAIYYTHWLIGVTVLTAFAPPQGMLINMLKALALMAAGVLLGEGLRRVPLLRRLV